MDIAVVPQELVNTKQIFLLFYFSHSVPGEITQ